MNYQKKKKNQNAQANSNSLSLVTSEKKITTKNQTYTIIHNFINFSYFVSDFETEHIK